MLVVHTKIYNSQSILKFVRRRINISQARNIIIHPCFLISKVRRSISAFILRFLFCFIMTFGHRKLLLFDEKTHVVLVKKYECGQCLMNCPAKCENGSNGHFPESSPPLPSWPSQKSSHMPSIFILMLSILGAAFVFLCYLTILRRYRSNLSSRRRNTAPEDGTAEDFIDENHGPMVIHPIWYIHTVGLQQSVIDSIAVFKYKKGEALIEGTDCSVCLSEFQDDENLRLLPKCSHAFHINCIDTWLRSHTNCPLCRAPIVRDSIPENDESVLNNSGSLESTSADSQAETDEVSDESTNRTTIGVENIDHSPNEESKILEMLKRNPHSIARNNRIRVLSDLADHRVRVEEELQPARRSVSLDAASASMIYAAVAKIHPVQEVGCSKVEELELKKHNSVKDTKPGDTKLIIHKSRKSFSFGRSLQKMPIRMKRSFSSSSKSSLPRHSRSQELVQTF